MQTEKRFLIITGGILNMDFARAYLKENSFDVIIAVDNGLSYAKELDLKIHAAVGDFDTAASELAAFYKADSSVEFFKLNPEKDATDTEVAIDLAIDREASFVVILGALGKRFDHALANVGMLYKLLKYGIKGFIVDEYNRISLIDAKCVIKKEEQYGKYISFLSYLEKIENITLKGFHYELKDGTLYSGSSLAVSNEITDEACEISFDKGIAIVIESRD